MTTKNERDTIRRAMRILGSRRSPQKTKSSRENAKLGGKPRRYIQCAGRAYHRFSRAGVCYLCGGERAKLSLTHA